MPIVNESINYDWHVPIMCFYSQWAWASLWRKKTSTAEIIHFCSFPAIESTNGHSPGLVAALHSDLYMWITTRIQIMLEESVCQPDNAHKLQQSWIKGFSPVKDFPFHLEAVTKVVLHNGRALNWVGLTFLCVQSPKHKLLSHLNQNMSFPSGFSERKTSNKRREKKKYW